MMALRFRNLLPFLIGAAWLWMTWRFMLGGPALADMKRMIGAGELARRYAEWEIAGWLLAMLATMIAADRLLCASLDRFFGVDPMKTHWSRLRNRDGAFFCARCRSIFMLPPEDLSDEGWVHCGDCGYAVAPYGEMKPLLLGWASAPAPPSAPPVD
jgi:hypothetical protein